MEQQLDRIEEGDVDWVRASSQEFYGPFRTGPGAGPARDGAVELAGRGHRRDCARSAAATWWSSGVASASSWRARAIRSASTRKPILNEIGVDVPSLRRRPDAWSAAPGGAASFTAAAIIPECDFTSWQRPAAVNCPRCGTHMVEQRRGGEVVRLACAQQGMRVHGGPAEAAACRSRAKRRG